MGFAEGIDEPYAIVEIGDIMLLAKEIACRTIGKNVVVKIAVEVTGNITTGEGKDDFIVELGVDGKRTTGDIEGSVCPLFGILEDGHETRGFERELVGSESASEPFKIGLLLVEVVKGLPLFLKAFVAAVFGGIGSIPGAVIGAFIIGIAESVIKGLDTILIVNGVISEQIGLATFSDAFTFVLLIIILVFKPTGLFGEKSTDKV